MPDPLPGAVLPAAVAPAAVPAQPQVQPTPAVPAKPAQSTPATPAAVPAQVPSGMVPLTALQEERTKRQELAAEIETLKRLVSNPGYQQQPQPQAVAQVDPQVELNKLWDTDPRKAVQVEIMYAMDWRDRVESSLNQQADQLAVKYPDFNNYRSSTLAHIRSLPAHQRGAQGVLEAVYNMMRGANIDTILKTREDELLERYRRGEITAQQLQTPAGSFSAPVPQGGVQLTADQLAVANAMGLTPEGYASQIKLAAPSGAR